jgi:Co/Zn/Cd efflux system component
MADDCCESSIDTSRLQSRKRRVLLTVMVVNFATCFGMAFASIQSGSSSLLSGTLDNLGDALTYAISFAVVGSSNLLKARVALFKGVLILAAGVAVAGQIGWRLLHPGIPLFDLMGIAACLNLLANCACLAMLAPYRNVDVNMASVWECSRNDVFEGFAVIAAAVSVWILGSGWPDIAIAVVLLVLFLRSALRVLRRAWRETGMKVATG